MGNFSCVPQPHRQFRYSFNRKSSIKGKEHDSRTKWTYLFGNESGDGRGTNSDNILHYIPGKDFGSPEILPKDSVDQRFLSIFRKGRKKTIVRNMGQMIHYSKVKFRFQHSQDVSDCYLEMFQSHLYFQSRGPTGLTYQGLVPLKELSIYKLERSKTPSNQVEEHAFRITGPLLNPLIVYCPSQQELQKWLYHLEKQIQLNGGNLDMLSTSEGNKETNWDKYELRRSVQSQPVADWEGKQRESLGSITYISKVKMQHLPFQELHERLLVLYSSSLVILSEERKQLFFKGELPLKAVRVISEELEKQKKSFLIEGRFINTIRVICITQQDYEEWIDHLKLAQLQNRESSLSGSSSFGGSHYTQHEQTVSCRSSFTSDGRTKSWASANKLPSSNRQSHSTTQGSERQSFTILSEQQQQHDDPLSPGYAEPLHCLGNPPWSTPTNGNNDLKRGGSFRGSKGKNNLSLQIQSALPHSYDLETTAFGLIPETPSEDILSPIYKEPYTYQKSLHDSSVNNQNMPNRWSLTDSQQSTSPTDSASRGLSKSPLYDEPYSPTDPHANNFVEEILKNLSNRRIETSSPHLRTNGSFQMNHSAHPALHKIYSHPVSSNQQIVKPLVHRNSEPDTRIPPSTQTSFFKSVSALKEEIASTHHSNEVEDIFDLPSSGNLFPESMDHDYAELQSFQSDLSYDNIWDYEAKERDRNHFSPPPYKGYYHQGVPPNKAVPSRWL
ncbi:pleckstrin homology domain-containing family N member 1 isoform X2 [Bombina bombina]|uniref:pleckstrin homology domain-containing family N member 1 isoform X2 n=1 Tax=Bombina bombina TaxID=8345 RepID=UPI00235A783E|nr:pleckstrin homology domain-containing family N member 1 isoform X2 [Bombina bombina]